MSLSNYPADFPETLRRSLDEEILKAEIKARDEWQKYLRRWPQSLDAAPRIISWQQLDGAMAQWIARECVGDLLFGRRLTSGGILTGRGPGFLKTAAEKNEPGVVRRWAEWLLPELIRYSYTVFEPEGMHVPDIEKIVTNETKRIISSRRWLARLKRLSSRDARAKENTTTAQQKTVVGDETTSGKKPQPESQLKSTETGNRRPIMLKHQLHDISDMPGIEHLTDRQREILSLKAEYGLNPAQIATHLGLHRTTVVESLMASTKKLQNYRDNQSKRRLARNVEEDGMIDRIDRSR